MFAAGLYAQAPAAGRGPQVAVAGPNNFLVVNQAAADRGRSLFAVECVNCHGALARGTDLGPNIIRSVIVLKDREGTTLGPFFKQGHKTQSGGNTNTFTQAQTADISHFLWMRINGLNRNVLSVQNVLTGDVKAGAAFFAEQKCGTCHSVTGDLAAIGRRLQPVDIQQRFLFPSARGGRGGPPPKPVTVSVTPVAGKPAIEGVLLSLDDFNVSVRDASGETFTFRRTPAMKIVKSDPRQFHYDLLEKITDKNMHDVVTYLETLK
jgi:mono/diheme cytochrome c family protein